MQLETSLSRLDELIAALEQENGGRCALLREHFQAARSYLLGAMPTEYKLNLRLADAVLDCITEPKLRREISHFIHSELRDEA